MARFNTWLPDNLIDAIKARSDETGVPQARIVRMAIEAHLDVKGVEKPKGPQPQKPDLSKREGAPRLRGQLRPKTAEVPHKAPRNTELSREIVEEEQVEAFGGNGQRVKDCGRPECPINGLAVHAHST